MKLSVEQLNVARRAARLRLWLLITIAGAAFCALAGYAVNNSNLTLISAAANPLAAAVRTKVAVPATMRSFPFDSDRYLNIPQNFQIAVYARVPNARFMAIAPNGDLLVSQPDRGKVSLVRANPNGDPLISDFVTGLRRPHDIVFHQINGATYVYISETHQINRFAYNFGDLTAHDRQIIVTGLADAEIDGELRGAHNHALKNIALDSNNNLYVSSASATNANPSDLAATPKRAAIYVYNAETVNQPATAGRLFAQGVRNAEGLAFVPGTDELWVVINNRDNIKYPFRNDFDRDGTDDFGKTMPGYVDNHPPELFTRVRDGGHYGWPFANSNPDSPSGLNNMPFDFDYDNNRDWSQFPETAFDRVSKGIQAHSAPLGLTFLQNTNAPAQYRSGALVAYHGSWNRTVRTGYKVAYFPWNAATNFPGDQVDLVTGWVNSDQSVWGRPVDAIVDQTGSILISDDQHGTIYKLTYNAPPPPTPTPTPIQIRVANLTLINADTDQPIAAFNPLADNAAFDLATLPTRNLNVRANTNPATVGSVRFALDGNQNYRLENAVPYALAGDANNGADYLPWTPTVGSHTLTATPFSGSNASGTAGQAVTVRFTVTDSANAAVITNGTYRLLAENSGKALDVAGAGQQDGADVIQWAANGGANQHWIVQNLNNGYYKLTAAHSNKVLDVTNGGTSDGTDVRQYSANGSIAQQWKIVAVGNNHYKLLSRSAVSKALDVSNGSPANGANVQIWSDNGTAAQRWRFVAVQ